MEESEACSLPGGLASVKKQFESQEYASSSQSQTSVTQVHVEKRSVQVLATKQARHKPYIEILNSYLFILHWGCGGMWSSGFCCAAQVMGSTCCFVLLYGKLYSNNI